MNDRNTEPRAVKLLEAIKPDLLKILSNAPSYGSCGMDLVFHNSEIVRIGLRAEISKIYTPEKHDGFDRVRK